MNNILDKPDPTKYVTVEYIQEIKDKKDNYPYNKSKIKLNQLLICHLYDTVMKTTNDFKPYVVLLKSNHFSQTMYKCNICNYLSHSMTTTCYCCKSKSKLEVIYK